MSRENHPNNLPMTQVLNRLSQSYTARKTESNMPRGGPDLQRRQNLAQYLHESPNLGLCCLVSMTARASFIKSRTGVIVQETKPHHAVLDVC